MSGLDSSRSAQGHAAALTAGQGGDIGIPWRQAQGVGGDLEAVLEVVGVAGLDDVLQRACSLARASKSASGSA
jgi:hypothetical protein